MDRKHYLAVSDGQFISCICSWADKSLNKRAAFEQHIRQATRNPNFIDLSQYGWQPHHG